MGGCCECNGDLTPLLYLTLDCELRSNQANFWRSICGHIDQVIQANEFLVLQQVGVTTSVSRQVIQEMRLAVQTQNSARVGLVVVAVCSI
jgi:hypothetical protein